MTMPTLLALVAVLSVAVVSHGAATQPAVSPAAAIEALAADPPSDGVMITFVAPGGAAAKAGVKLGDLLTHYDGAAVTSMAALQRATLGGESNEGLSKLTVIRGGKTLTLETVGGRLGINGKAVRKGESFKLMPAGTEVTFDFFQLPENVPQEEWRKFVIDGKHVGFEHIVFTRSNAEVTMRAEVAFLMKGYPPQHMIATVTSVVEKGKAPALFRMRWEMPGAKYVCESVLGKDSRWHVTETEDGKEVGTATHENFEKLQADWFMTQAVRFMGPLKEGTCFRFANVEPSAVGEVTPLAILISKRETLEHGGKEEKVWRVERWQWGEVARTSWMTDDGKVLKHDYGAKTESILSTKEEAIRIKDVSALLGK